MPLPLHFSFFFLFKTIWDETSQFGGLGKFSPRTSLGLKPDCPTTHAVVYTHTRLTYSGGSAGTIFKHTITIFLKLMNICGAILWIEDTKSSQDTQGILETAADLTANFIQIWLQYACVEFLSCCFKILFMNLKVVYK